MERLKHGAPDSTGDFNQRVHEHPTVFGLFSVPVKTGVTGNSTKVLQEKNWYTMSQITLVLFQKVSSLTYRRTNSTPSTFISCLTCQKSVPFPKSGNKKISRYVWSDEGTTVMCHNLLRNSPLPPSSDHFGPKSVNGELFKYRFSFSPKVCIKWLHIWFKTHNHCSKSFKRCDSS